MRGAFAFLLLLGCGSADGGVATDAGSDLSAPIVDPADAGAPLDASVTDAASFACTGKIIGEGDRIVIITSSGILRTALLHVPASYDPAKGSMAVLNFHGYTSNGVEQAALSEMNLSSDKRGYVVAYPNGIEQSWNAGTCCGAAQTTGVDDIQFVRDLLADLEAEYCIDPNRVYATGMSNGAFLTHRIGCEMSDTFAAIAPVAGVIGVPSCMPKRAVPVIHFHGTADAYVPYTGSQTLGFISVADSISRWKTADGCADSSSTMYSKGDATCVAYAACAGGSEVVLCTIDQGGHTWPGGFPIPPFGKTSTDISATDTMIDFFEAHPLLR